MPCKGLAGDKSSDHMGWAPVTVVLARAKSCPPVGDPSPSPSSLATTSQDYMMGNSVCLGVAGVVLLILVVILAEAGHSWCGSQHGPQGWRHEGAQQRDWTPGPQEGCSLGS